MGLLRRIAVILKSYGRSWEEWSETDRVAQEELRRARARARAQDEQTTADTSAARPVASRRTTAAAVQLAADFRLLGVRPDADLDAVEARWRELAHRADPKRFPAGSEEEKKAAAILTSINEAYERIRESLNPTEGRFGRLEL